MEPGRSSFRSMLGDRVYFAARDGMAITIYALLYDNMDIADELLNQHFDDEEGQRCTPLIIAAKNGHNKVVKTLLSNFNINLELEGTVKLNNCIIEGASALWVAAGSGYLNVVKTLVKSGANVNHTTSSNSTPLRAACFDGRLDIVKFLTEHYADIHIANTYNNTCLMIAAYKGHLDVVSFLLEKGANPDDRASCGATALHFAAQCGHTSVVEEMLKYGAAIVKNEDGMTPLMIAAERSRSDVVECLISRPEFSQMDMIEALELLGASFANDKDNYSLQKAYHFMLLAMKLRHSDPENIIRKPITTPVPAYENCVECQTVQDLEAIRRNHNALHMQALTIRERILGRHSPEVPQPVIFRGAVYADSARFDRCIDLWLHALHLRQLNHTSVVTDLLRFAQIFSQMLYIGVELPFENVMAVLQASVKEIAENKRKILNPPPKENMEQILDELDSNINTVLYILIVITKLMKRNVDDETKSRVYQLVYELNRMNISNREGQTLLHLSVNFQTPVDSFHTNQVCKFPCARLARLLIKCGADVNSMDFDRNTPLHLIVRYQKPVSDFLTLHSIILDLIEAGAHMDVVNSLGKTPFEAATTGVSEIILRTQSKIRLQCLAARAIKKYDLDYQGQVPKSLEDFIELHGPGHINMG